MTQSLDLQDLSKSIEIYTFVGNKEGKNAHKTPETQTKSCSDFVLIIVWLLFQLLVRCLFSPSGFMKFESAWVNHRFKLML